MGCVPNLCPISVGERGRINVDATLNFVLFRPESR